MRLSREDTMELMMSIINVRMWEKPGPHSSEIFKAAYNHPKFDELDKAVKELKQMEIALKNNNEDFNNYMKKVAFLINTFLDI